MMRSTAHAAVPVPSSDVTLATIESARFPTLRLCRALAGAGLGDVCVLAAQAKALPPKHDGHDYSTENLLANLRRTAVPIPRASIIVLVDDNIHRGRSLIAMDQFIGAPGAVAAFSVAITDSQPRADAYKPRKFELRYDPSVVPLDGVVVAP